MSTTRGQYSDNPRVRGGQMRQEMDDAAEVRARAQSAGPESLGLRTKGGQAVAKRPHWMSWLGHLGRCAQQDHTPMTYEDWVAYKEGTADD